MLDETIASVGEQNNFIYLYGNLSKCNSQGSVD
jgi:hypothetical protein